MKEKRRRITTEDVFDYVVRYSAERAGKSAVSRYPPLKIVAAHFRAEQSEIEDLIELGTAKGYIGLGVGFLSRKGLYDIKNPGDRQVEAYV